MGRVERVLGGGGDSCSALIVQLEDMTGKGGNVHTLAASLDYSEASGTLWQRLYGVFTGG